jgi:sugar/nucleoside kinase (ribokinase family)
VDYLIVSKDFSCKLMQDTNLESALRRMQARYNCKLSAATLGEEGVLAWDGRKFYRSAAYKVPVVDTTGAGDIFRAGFIYGLLQEWPLDRLLDFSCAAAAMNCMAAGARGGIKTVEAVENLRSTVSRYENGLKVPVIDAPVLDERDADRVSR